MHKSICAINDDPPGKCDCNYLERKYGEPLRKAQERIIFLELENKTLKHLLIEKEKDE